MKISKARWEQANLAETQSWNTVLSDNKKVEETDIYYRHFPVMDLPLEDDGRKLRVIDIGGGPLSGMLHFKNITGSVVDPILFESEWISRYTFRRISYYKATAEDFLAKFNREKYDEVWIYNCLLHVRDVEFILESLYKVAPILRISEPCGTTIDTWHPHTFTKEYLSSMLNKISTSGEERERMYDYLYYGGVYNLK